MIYSKMGVLRLEEFYKYRLGMFLFKNQDLFQLHHNPHAHTRQTVSRQAAVPRWRKEHSRMQGGYQGAIQFNNLRPDVREEKRLSAYKRQIRGSVT